MNGINSQKARLKALFQVMFLPRKYPASTRKNGTLPQVKEMEAHRLEKGGGQVDVHDQKGCNNP